MKAEDLEEYNVILSASYPIEAENEEEALEATKDALYEKDVIGQGFVEVERMTENSGTVTKSGLLMSYSISKPGKETIREGDEVTLKPGTYELAGWTSAGPHHTDEEIDIEEKLEGLIIAKLWEGKTYYDVKIETEINDIPKRLIIIAEKSDFLKA